jgi:hypothetical protein
MRCVMAAAVLACVALLSPVSAAPKADISGKWHFVLQTEGGDREREATFQQTGNKVTGKWDDADVQGTFEDGKLDLEFPVTSEEAGKGTLILKGQAAEDSLTGTWEFQSYSGTFKATREH